MLNYEREVTIDVMDDGRIAVAVYMHPASVTGCIRLSGTRFNSWKPVLAMLNRLQGYRLLVFVRASGHYLGEA